MSKCSTCGANWSAGDWNPECMECGPGALSCPCLMCGGECGRKWHRAVLDSNDYGMPVFGGGCGKEKQEIITEVES